MKKQLSKSDIQKLNEEINEKFGVDDFFGKKDRIIQSDIEKRVYIIKDDMAYFFYDNEQLVPTLKLLMDKPLLKQVIVDMGAVKFMVSGADVMRPGITEINDSIEKDEVVMVVDETHKKPLCVARALFSGKEITEMQKGKVLKTLHFVGDPIWNLSL